jgi:hypothetical protein
MLAALITVTLTGAAMALLHGGPAFACRCRRTGGRRTP